MEVDANRSVGRVLKQIRESIGLTQEELAANLGKPQSFVSKTESGERSLRAYELFDYSDALGISPHDVIRILSPELDKNTNAQARVRYAFVRF